MIVSSGYNIAGAEVENALLAAARRGRVRRRRRARRGARPDRQGVRRAARRGHALGRAASRRCRTTSSRRSRPTSTRARSSSWRRCRGRRPARCSDSSCVRATATGAGRPDGGVAVHEPAGWARPVGYANAVSAAGRTVFVSGRSAGTRCRATFPSLDFAGQVEQALKNVVAALAAAGARPEQIVRLTWYVTDRERVPERPQGDRRQLSRDHRPALPGDVGGGGGRPGRAAALVEIEATAVIGDRFAEGVGGSFGSANPQPRSSGELQLRRRRL